MSSCRNFAPTADFWTKTKMNSMGENVFKSTAVKIGEYTPPSDMLDSIGYPSLVSPRCDDPALCSRFNSSQVSVKQDKLYFPSSLFHPSSQFAPTKGDAIDGEEDPVKPQHAEEKSASTLLPQTLKPPKSLYLEPCAPHLAP